MGSFGDDDGQYNVQKHLSVNTMSVANLRYLSHLGEHLGERNSQAFADKHYIN